MKKRVQLVDIDSVFPNLALMKLSTYHKSNGDIVGFDIIDPDIVYISVIFDKNKQKAIDYGNRFVDTKIVIGGTGYDHNMHLPNNIEFLKPDYDLYTVCSKCGHSWKRKCRCRNKEEVPQWFSMGFTSRGCVRNCKFCIVNSKEGKLKEWNDILNFHDSQHDTIMLLDNNLLACDFPVCGSCNGSPKQIYWEYILEYFIQNKIKLWEHGMDARLLSQEQAKFLSKITPAKGVWKFAFDNIKDEPYIERTIGFMNNAGIRSRNLAFYVLVGYNTTHDQDVYRVKFLRERGVNANVMPFNSIIINDDMKHIDRYTNNKYVYWGVEWEEYLENAKQGKWKADDKNQLGLEEFL